MAHFSRIEQKPNPFTSELEWTVQECIVISNDIPTSAGPLGENDMHIDGETYVKNLYKHMYSEEKNIWKQYSYNNEFRNSSAGKDSVYLETSDRFIGSQPYASWHLSNETFNWVAPVARPTIETYTNPLAGEDMVDVDGNVIVDVDGNVIGTEPDQAIYYMRWDETEQKWYSNASHLIANADTHEWDPSGEVWNLIT